MSEDSPTENGGPREESETPVRTPTAGKRHGTGSRRLVRTDVGRKPRGPTTPTVDDRVTELERMNRDMMTRNRILQRALRASSAGTEVSSGMAGEEVGGRMALASFRTKTWEKLSTQVLKLPSLCLKYGRSRTREMVAAGLLADLDTLALGRSWTKREAKQRAALTHFLTDRGKLNVMMGGDSAGRAMRTLFLQQCAQLFYLPSVARLFEKSMENFMPGMMGPMEG